MSAKCALYCSVQECQCIPWDMPRPDESETRICDYAGNQCFHKKMKNITYQEESCRCVPRCDATHYSFHLESQLPIAVKDECEIRARGFEYVFEKLNLDLETYQAIKNLLQNTSLTYQDWKNIFDTSNSFVLDLVERKCKEIFSKDIAIVQLKMEKDSYIKMKKSLKYNTTIKLGTIGGTIGLFTGFSFMALVEIAYWVLVTLKRIFGRMVPVIKPNN